MVFAPFDYIDDRLRFYPLNFYARCVEVVPRGFTTSLVAALPSWEQARNKLPTSYLCATGYASVPMLGRALAEPVAPGKPEKRNREVISDLFSTRQRRSQRGSERAVYNFSASCVEVERIESKKLWAGGRRAECAR